MSKRKYERKKPFDRRASWRCIEYWTGKGYSEEDARKQISEKQRSINNKKKNHSHSPETKRKISKALKRVFTDEWFKQKYGHRAEEERRLYKERQRNRAIKALKTKKKNGFNFRKSSIRCVEYWLAKGYSEEEARFNVSLSQSRSLGFYIKKYPLDEALRRWKKKNDSWFRSMFTEKTPEELSRINEKRKMNAHVGYYTEKTIKRFDNLYFYAFVFIDEDGTKAIKYGLTKQNHLYKRWSPHLVSNVLFFEKLPPEIALKIEQDLNKKFKRSYQPNVIQTTECLIFNDENLQILTEVYMGAINAKN